MVGRRKEYVVFGLLTSPVSGTVARKQPIWVSHRDDRTLTRRSANGSGARLLQVSGAERRPSSHLRPSQYAGPRRLPPARGKFYR